MIFVIGAGVHVDLNASLYQKRARLALERGRTSHRRHREVCVETIVALGLCSHPPVVKRGRVDTVLGAATIALDVASEAAEAFAPLKAVLGVISAVYTQYEVCSQPFLKLLPDKLPAGDCCCQG